MKILIAYATTDGQTRKIARFVADHLADHGQAVELLCTDDTEGLNLARFDAAVLAGSLHAGGFQKSLARFATDQALALSAKPSLFLSVSLSAAGDDADDWAGLERCLATFTAQTGWKPGRTAHVAGAFRFTEYDFFRSWAMQRIARLKGEDVDTNSDKEYTDWPALVREIDTWIAGLKPV